LLERDLNGQGQPAYFSLVYLRRRVKDHKECKEQCNEVGVGDNTAINDINTQFQVNSATNTVGGPLNADSSLQDAQGALLGAAAYAVSGNNGLVNLASIGIDLNNDGTLTVNQSKLSSALAGNYSSVQNLLQNTNNGFVQNLNKTLSSLVDPGNGSLTLDAQGLTATSQSLTQTISDLQASYNTQQQNLILVYSQVNTTLQELPLLQSQLSQQLSGAGIA
jgi:flagellar hook-associated protein 2